MSMKLCCRSASFAITCTIAIAVAVGASMYSISLQAQLNDAIGERDRHSATVSELRAVIEKKNATIDALREYTFSQMQMMDELLEQMKPARLKESKVDK